MYIKSSCLQFVLPYAGEPIYRIRIWPMTIFRTELFKRRSVVARGPELGTDHVSRPKNHVSKITSQLNFYTDETTPRIVKQTQ